MLAESIMEPLTSYLTPNLTLKEAVAIMNDPNQGYDLPDKGMVVLDSEKHLVGILSNKDLLRALIPHYLEEGSLAGVTWEGMLKDRAEKVRLMLVKEVMSSKPLTVLPTASPMSLTQLMIENNIQRLPVVDKGGQVLGVVYIRDIYNYIYKTVHIKE